MKNSVKERSAGAVVFRRDGSKIFYLLLLYKAKHWDFPKGHVEKGEGDGDAAIREIEEETGIKNPKIIEGFREEIKYSFRGSYLGKKKLINKTVIFFLAETKTSKIKISFEHSGFDWLVFEEAFRRITHKNSKRILQEADSFLKNKTRSL